MKAKVNSNQTITLRPDLCEPSGRGPVNGAENALLRSFGNGHVFMSASGSEHDAGTAIYSITLHHSPRETPEIVTNIEEIFDPSGTFKVGERIINQYTRWPRPDNGMFLLFGLLTSEAYHETHESPRNFIHCWLLVFGFHYTQSRDYYEHKQIPNMRITIKMIITAIQMVNSWEASNNRSKLFGDRYR